MLYFYTRFFVLFYLFLCISIPVTGIKFFDKAKKGHKSGAFKYKAEEVTNPESGFGKSKELHGTEGHYEAEKGFGTNKEIHDSKGHSYEAEKEVNAPQGSFDPKDNFFHGKEGNEYGPSKDQGILSELKNLKDDFISDLSNIKETISSGKKKLLSGSLKQKFVGKKEVDPTKDVEDDQPVCPIKIKPTYEEAIVEQAVHSVVTVTSVYDVTQWEHVTETVPYAVTVTETSIVTQPANTIDVTETRIIPEEKTETTVKLVTTDRTILDTALSISTYTVSNTITTTDSEPEWVTVKEYSTEWTTQTITAVRTTTEWVTHIETIKQPAYITTSIWVEAPQLLVVTSTKTQPHYMTTTSLATKVVKTTVCED